MRQVLYAFALASCRGCRLRRILAFPARADRLHDGTGTVAYVQHLLNPWRNATEINSLRSRRRSADRWSSTTQPTVYFGAGTRSTFSGTVSDTPPPSQRPTSVLCRPTPPGGKEPSNDRRAPQTPTKTTPIHHLHLIRLHIHAILVGDRRHYRDAQTHSQYRTFTHSPLTVWISSIRSLASPLMR